MSKNKINKTIEVSALAAILLLICFCQVGLAAGSSVSVSPPTITASHGDVFSIDIIVNPAGSDVYGAQYGLDFDKNILKATSQDQGTFLGHDGSDTIEVTNNIDNDIGKIDYGETRIGDPETVGGTSENGVLASITFEVIGSGTSELKLEAMLADSSAQEISAVVNNGTCNVEGAGAGDVPTSNTPEGQTPEKEGLPGFGAVCSIIGLIVATLLVVKKD